MSPIMPVLMKSAAAAAAVAGLAFAAVETEIPAAYDGDFLRTLSEAELAAHAGNVFSRADMDENGALDADEYTALSVVTAELARLNGFVVVERQDKVGVIALPAAQPASLPRSEHIRIAAVARHTFYAFAGEDGRMSADEFAASQGALFQAADLNRNGRLARKELSIFAQRQASLTIGA